MDALQVLAALGDYPGEQRKARAALVQYALLPVHRRSLEVLAAELRQAENPPTRQISRLKKWSTRFEWQRRVQAVDRLAQEDEAGQWIMRRRQLRESDWTDGETARVQARGHLTAAQRTGDVLAAMRAVTMLREASQLQRLAANEPLSILQVTGAQLDSVIEHELARVAGGRPAGFGGAVDADRDAGGAADAD